MSINGTDTEAGVYTPSPRPHPRIRPEAMENAQRNRGGMERWFDYSDNVQNYSSPRPGERLRSDSARKIAEVNKGKISECMEGHPAPPMQRHLHPRVVKSEAGETAEGHKGKGMRNLIENYGNLGISDRPALKVKGDDAQENLERNHGTINKLMNNFGHLPLSPQPAQKVKYGGEEVAEKYRGAGMGPILRMEGQKSTREVKVGRLHKESQGGGWDETPPHVRTRPEAEGIVNKNKTTSMGDILKMEYKPPNYREPKVLKHMVESTSSRPRTSPARTRPEAMQYYQRNTQCEMSAILRGEPQQPVSTPRRNLRMLQRSEEW